MPWFLSTVRLYFCRICLTTANNQRYDRSRNELRFRRCPSFVHYPRSLQCFSISPSNPLDTSTSLFYLSSTFVLLSLFSLLEFATRGSFVGLYHYPSSVAHGYPNTGRQQLFRNGLFSSFSSLSTPPFTR